MYELGRKEAEKRGRNQETKRVKKEGII